MANPIAFLLAFLAGAATIASPFVLSVRRHAALALRALSGLLRVFELLVLCSAVANGLNTH